MWKYVLSGRRIKGYQFRRQRPVLNYIADFMCPELMLIIEIDGITHDDEIAVLKDKKRDLDLEAIGFTVLRFSSWEVLNRIPEVGCMVLKWIEENTGTSPSGNSTP